MKIDALLSSPQAATAEDLFFGALLFKIDSLSWEECLDGSYLATASGVYLSRRSKVGINRGTVCFPAFLFYAAASQPHPDPGSFLHAMRTDQLH